MRARTEYRRVAAIFGVVSMAAVVSFASFASAASQSSGQIVPIPTPRGDLHSLYSAPQPAQQPAPQSSYPAGQSYGQRSLPPGEVPAGTAVGQPAMAAAPQSISSQSGLSQSIARGAAQARGSVPAWLEAHVGVGPGQIAWPVLKRARALYMSRVAEGRVKNPCYFAMDATKPNDPGDGGVNGKLSGGRFYVVCEATQSFRAIAAGHGSGKNFGGVADFSNGRTCVRNFGNAMDSNLTMGGDYLTAEIKTSFKGYYKGADNRQDAYLRSFLQFDGEGDTANARPRAIGGHAAAKVSGVCMMRNASSPYANKAGLVPFGSLVNYSGGRSDGCTSWSPQDATQIMALTKDNPTTLYIYPEASDIKAIDRALTTHASFAQAGIYWNEDCLKQIGAPKFWPKEQLEPVIAKWKADHPPKPGKPIPLCPGQ